MIIICGIIGFTSPHVTSKDLKVIKQVMIESRIRGKHASGIAWFDGQKLQSYVKPIAIDELLKKFDLNQVVHDGQVSMIAHARYSTSDIRYNQPIVGNSMAIVHNGVITQTDPKTWTKQFGYTCKTQNDSELILRAVENGDNPLVKFSDSSIAALVLDNTGQLCYMRNAQRPLWMGNVGKGIVYASTYDILQRSGVTGIGKIIASDYKDLQRRNYQQWETHKQQA